jgi:hypothetical protein
LAAIAVAGFVIGHYYLGNEHYHRLPCGPSAGRLTLALCVRSAGRRDLAQFGAVADGGGVTDPEQMGEPQRVTAACLGFPQEQVFAQVLGGDASAPGPQPGAQVPGGELVERPCPAASEKGAGADEAWLVSGVAGLVKSTRRALRAVNSDRIAARASAGWRR